MSDASADVANQINTLSADEAPAMPEQESVYVDLLNGKRAQIRELNGEDEEYLASVENKPNATYSEYLTEVLKRSVLSLDGAPPGDLGKLINGDRDMLMLGTMRATYGPEKTVRVVCQECHKQNDVVIDLGEDFPIKRPDFDINAPIKVSTRKGDYLFNVPTGEDTNAAAKTKNAQEGNTLILSRTAVFADGKEPKDRLEWARKLNAAVRAKAVETLLAIELGPQLEVVNTQCAHCDADIAIGLDWVSLLLG